MPHLTVDVVLTSVDFLEVNWENTVKHAANQAVAHGARLHLVNVTEKPHWLTRRVMDEAALQDYLSTVRDIAVERLDRAAALAPEGLEVSIEVRSGKPAIQVLEAAEEHGAGLIVTGIQPPTATSFMLGGTTDRLLRMSPVPVYVAGPRPPRPIKRVLVTTGLGPSGGFAIGTALEQLTHTDGEVRALYMVALPSVMNAYSGDVLKLRADIESMARDEFNTHVAAIEVPEGYSPVVRRLVSNLEVVPAHDTILEEARTSDCDLICFALGGRGRGPGQLIGRISGRVVRAAPCSVLALPDPWVAEQLGT